MSNFSKTKTGKITSVLVSLTTGLWLSGAAAIMPVVARASTVDELQAQITALLAQIQQLQSQLVGLEGGDGEVCGYTFATDLSKGDKGGDVKNLQIVLNSDSATQVAGSGVGSSGEETEYFGSLTEGAAIKFQEKYASEVLTPLGLGAGTGYIGASSRAKLNELYGTCAPVVEGEEEEEGGEVAPGTGLTVSAGTQPSVSLAVQGATRLPYTRIVLTAGSDGPVTVNSIGIERVGLGSNAAFSGIILLDEEGTQLGNAKTLNSVNKATIGEAFTIPAATSKTLTIAGNLAASLSSYAGEVPYLSVIAVNTSAEVSGVLPITGVGHTINSSLAIGSVTMAVGSLDPGSSQTKEIGTTGYTFSSVRITAGSAEKIRVQSIRWNMSGSAAIADLANVKTYVDGNAYDIVVSADGKYYTSTFNGGIIVDKGANLEVSVKGDIADGAGRGIDFDIYKRTDIYITGETYGYGITPPNGSDTSGTDDGAFHQSTNPWYDAYQVTVSTGTLNVQKGSDVAAQNIAINVANQPFGGFLVEAKGEEISVASMVFRITITDSDSGGEPDGVDIDNVSLYDANGAVVAGPVDATGAAESATVTFSDTITFPVGKHLYTLKGKVTTDFENNDTIAASTTPSTDWTTVTGQTTGNSITPSPTSAITANTMTVKAASLAISVSPDPVAQTVVSGGSFTFANYYFDATGSGEDIKMTSIPLAYGVNGAGTATNLTTCSLWEGSTQLTTGSNIVNPSAAGSSTAFTLDGAGLVIPKGTVKTIGLKCDIAGSATGSYLWGIDAGATFSGTGLTSGQSVTPTATDSNGQLMTLASAGTLTVVLDSSSPSYAIASANTTGNTLAEIKFSAVNEAITISRVALQLTNPAASSSRQDLSKVTLWYGSIQVGEVVFTTSNYATSTLTGSFVVPKDGDNILTVKGDFSAIGSSQPGTQGHLIAVDYDGGDSTGTRGVGQNSGSTIDQGSTADTASSGVRVFKSFPTLAKITTGIASTLANGDQPVLRFSVTADSAGDVGLDEFSIRIATTSVTAGSINAYAYTDSGFSTPVSGVNASGKLMNTNAVWADSSTDIEIDVDSAGTDTALQVPAGSTRYFEVRADISGANASGDSISTTLQGDAGYASLSAVMGNAAAIDADSNDDFIWSPNATTTSALGHTDWTNGYGLSVLPAGGMNTQTISR